MGWVKVLVVLIILGLLGAILKLLIGWDAGKKAGYEEPPIYNKTFGRNDVETNVTKLTFVDDFF